MRHDNVPIARHPVTRRGGVVDKLIIIKPRGRYVRSDNGVRARRETPSSCTRQLGRNRPATDRVLFGTFLKIAKKDAFRTSANDTAES